MNTFSIEVSKRLREIGVEETETETYFCDYRGDGQVYFIAHKVGSMIKHPADGMVDFDGRKAKNPKEYIPRYTLHDIFRLMPKIGEKMGWKLKSEMFMTHDSVFVVADKTYDEFQYKSVLITCAFSEGDYPFAEKVLLDLLKEHAQPKQ